MGQGSDLPYRKIQEEHEGLQGSLERIEEALEGVVPEPDPRELEARAAGLAEALRNLAGLIERHFATEEVETGFFEEVLKRLPHATREVERLVGQHGELLERTRRLAEEASGTGTSALTAPRGLVEDIARLIRDLHRHERAEDDLIQQAFYLDLGALD